MLILLYAAIIFSSFGICYKKVMETNYYFKIMINRQNKD